MYGWRLRLGHVCPSIWDTNSYELDKVLPEGVMQVIVTLNLQKHSSEEIERKVPLIEDAVKVLEREGADVIVIGGDPLITHYGYGFDRKLISKVTEEVKIPVSTTVTVAVEALKSLNAKKVVISSPQTTGTVNKLKDFLEAEGFAIPYAAAMEFMDTVGISRLSYDASYRFARECFAQAPDADALYIPCARLPVVDNIKILEADLGVPVVTSIQAMSWWALRQAGIRPGIRNFGTLLANLG